MLIGCAEIFGKCLLVGNHSFKAGIEDYVNRTTSLTCGLSYRYG